MLADITPFGFTATENVAYRALLDLGPSSAYAVARRLTIARANAYQALDGLVGKGAASMVGTAPRRYRATQPRTLLAQLVESQARRLDRLEQQIEAEVGEGERPLVWLTGSRAVFDTATRAILRAGEPVRCLGEAEALDPLGPAIRARVAAGRAISVWAVGPTRSSLPSVAGTIPQERLAPAFPTVPLLLVGDGALVAARSPGGQLSGYWGEDPLFRGLVEAAMAAVTTP